MKCLKGIRKEIRRHWGLYAMCLPAVLLLLIFNYIPMLGVVMAFQQLDLAKGVFNSPFVGLKNFEFLFATTDAWIITRNTILYNVVFIVLGLFLAVSLALILSELRSKLYSKVTQTILIMPHFLSYVIVGMIAFAFLSPTEGFINSALEQIGIAPVNWYATKGAWPFILVFVHMWKNVGYSSVIYLATISGISDEYYEAALLDGASKFQQAIYITIPHLKFIICINLISQIGSIFRTDFGLFYTVPRDSGFLYSVTDTLDTYIYRSLMNMGNPGMTSAAAFYQSIVGFILVLIANKVISMIDNDCAMF